MDNILKYAEFSKHSYSISDFVNNDILKVICAKTWIKVKKIVVTVPKCTIQEITIMRAIVAMDIAMEAIAVEEDYTIVTATDTTVIIDIGIIIGSKLMISSFSTPSVSTILLKIYLILHV